MKIMRYGVILITVMLGLSANNIVLAEGGMENAEEFMQKVVERSESESSNIPGKGGDYIALPDSSVNQNQNTSDQDAGQNQQYR